jgi:Type II secretion system (T2SS), protein M subtype b
MNGEELMAFVRKNLISVGCAAFSLVIGFLIYYRSDMLPDARGVLEQKQKQGELLAANIEDSGQLKEQHAALVAANETITDRMIHIDQLAENTGYFYRLESETGTKLADPHQIPWTAPPKNAPKTNFTSVAFAITASGSYPQLLDLLRKLESGEHYCRVDTLSLKPISNQRGSQLSMIVNIDLMAVPE